MISYVEPVAPEILSEALSLCQEASKQTLKWFQSLSLMVESKADGSPVTQVDRQVEDFLRTELNRRWPDDSIVGEERPAQPGHSGRTWFVDPIDGTKSFVHGVPLYGTLLAMHDEQGPAVGVISLPALGEVVYAGRGCGCYAEKRSEGGSSQKVPARVRGASTGETSAADAAQLPAQLTGKVVSMSGMEYLPASARQHLLDSDVILRTWGDAYGYSLLATGRIDAMVDYGMSPWDTAPMAVIVTEAGGVISSWEGGDAMSGSSVLASTAGIHPKLVELLAEPTG